MYAAEPEDAPVAFVPVEYAVTSATTAARPMKNLADFFIRLSSLNKI
jgi:hypothetical protein